MARVSSMCACMSAQQFEAALERHPRLSAKARDAARRVLVDGCGIDAAAGAIGSSRKLVHLWATTVYQAFTPSGWVSRVVTLPAADMAAVQEAEATARRRLRAAPAEFATLDC